MALDKSKSQNSPFNVDASIPSISLRQTFNTTQNWTVPDGVYGIWVLLAGGGGGGNGKLSTGAGGQAGSGGNGTFGYTVVTPGSTVGITIGAGGNGGTYQTTVVDGLIGNEGGVTSVNTVGTCWSAGGALRSGTPNTTNVQQAVTYIGKTYGITRQQIVFGPKSTTPRTAISFKYSEGSGTGGVGPSGDYSTMTNANANGNNSTYGGAGGGTAVASQATAGGIGGNQLITGYAGGSPAMEHANCY